MFFSLKGTCFSAVTHSRAENRRCLFCSRLVTVQRVGERVNVMALCSFFFLIIILLLSPAALLPLGRSSRAEPAAVKLSALKGCLLSELYLSHMHPKCRFTNPNTSHGHRGYRQRGSFASLGFYPSWPSVFLEQSR